MLKTVVLLICVEITMQTKCKVQGPLNKNVFLKIYMKVKTKPKVHKQKSDAQKQTFLQR